MNISGSLVKKIPAPLPGIIDFSLYSNLFVAGVTTSASFYYQKQTGFVSIEYLIFLFFSTLFIYNLEHRKIKKRDFINKPLRCLWLEENKRKVDLLTFASLLICIACLIFNFDRLRLFGSALMLLLSLIYCTDSLLRKIAISKNLLLAVIWSGATVIMPHFWLSTTISSYTAFSLFLLISLSNSLLCDREDKKGDYEDGMVSLINKLSCKSSTLLLTVLNLLIMILSIKSEYKGLCITALCYGYFTLLPIKQQRAPYIYDICLILPLIATVTLQALL